jgi:diguanylate cyclase (GGDEF)-like protein
LTSALRVIVAEDDRATRRLLGAMVRDLGHEVVMTADGDEAWSEYQAGGADVIITDWKMPIVDGGELIRRIRSQPVGAYTYVIVVTSLAERSHALEAVKSGTDDYLPKPIHPVDLEVRLSIAARVTSLHSALLFQRKELWQLNRDAASTARTDPLTGLGNRYRMLEDLEAARARAERYGHASWLALGDIDRLASYTERHGHLAGDRVVGEVADALRRTGRKGDVLFRCGGDEFLVVLPEQTEATAFLAADRLRNEVEALRLEHPANTPFGLVTISFGVAELTSASAADAALAKATESLKSAKAAGRNTVSSGRTASN